jgi:hypothetical protein
VPVEGFQVSVAPMFTGEQDFICFLHGLSCVYLHFNVLVYPDLQALSTYGPLSKVSS